MSADQLSPPKHAVSPKLGQSSARLENSSGATQKQEGDSFSSHCDATESDSSVGGRSEARAETDRQYIASRRKTPK